MREITVAHSPDADDAFMFWALSTERVTVPGVRFVHVLKDIESLNRDAFKKTYDVTAVSIHGYAYLHRDYALLTAGGSIGDRYGPRVVATRPTTREGLRGRRVAHPGELTTAYLALKLWQPDCTPVAMDFGAVGDAVKRGDVDAGVIIHEGQLTYGDEGFTLVQDLGEWWHADVGLKLPLGANAIRRDLGQPLLGQVATALKRTIEAGLEHRQEALTHALRYGRGLDRARADAFVGMYVNAETVEMSPETRRSAQLLLDRGHAAGVIPERVALEFVACA
ncbi:MAG TPA: MqnA/MqnD/SBP family protein [Planctomycetota bacterium]|nr:MqnA/MqnD/SBP family protein [Planctomycetota bacterium]